jgi:protein-tyrosine phosphatase
MIDWHSHILPEMDDGSKNTAMSLEMLSTLKSQGIECVIATPHFYPNLDSLENFLSRRQKSYETLSGELTEDLPKVICGAEVQYYHGISHMNGLEKLVIGDTNLLLLEMPMSKWSDHEVKEVIELSGMHGLTIVLAHIDRYMQMQSSKVFEKLCESGILMQVNASFFSGFTNKRKALRWLDEGKIHFIGSDCHNLSSRPPKIGFAYELIENKFGDYFAHAMDDYGHRMLNRNKSK